METTCGHPDDQKEYGRPPLLYIYIPAIMVSTVYICVHRAGNRQSTTERLHVRDFFLFSTSINKRLLHPEIEITIAGLKLERKHCGQSFESL